MVISTQILTDSSNKKLNLSSKSSNLYSGNLDNRSSKEVASTSHESSSNSKVSKKDDFKEILNSRKNSKDNSTDSVSKDNKAIESCTDNSKINELKEKIEKLKEKAENGLCDEKDINDVLASLLNALNNLIANNQDVDSKVLENNLTLVQPMVEGATAKTNESSSIIEQLIQVLNNDSCNSNLDFEALSGMKELLGQLSAQYAQDNTEVSNNTKNNINDVISKITQMLEEADNKGEDVLTIQNMLNKNYSQDEEGSLDNKKNKESAMLNSNKETSKEDKFLNSLIDDKDSSLDSKINLLGTRTQNVQGQNTEARGLTINKATFTGDLIKDVKYMATNSLKELTVKVNPGNLGEITIKLIQEDGLMKANLRANSRETTALLSQNLAEIKKELVDQNIKISDVNIELYNDDTTFFKNDSFGSQFSNEQRNSNNQSKNNINSNLNVQENEDVEDNMAESKNSLDTLA